MGPGWCRWRGRSRWRTECRSVRLERAGAEGRQDVIEHIEGVRWVFAPGACAVEHRLELLAAFGEEPVGRRLTAGVRDRWVRGEPGQSRVGGQVFESAPTAVDARDRHADSRGHVSDGEHAVAVFDLINSAIDVTAAIVEGIHADRLPAPSLCSGWDNRFELNHLVDGMRVFAGELSGALHTTVHLGFGRVPGHFGRAQPSHRSRRPRWRPRCHDRTGRARRSASVRGASEHHAGHGL